MILYDVLVSKSTTPMKRRFSGLSHSLWLSPGVGGGRYRHICKEEHHNGPLLDQIDVIADVLLKSVIRSDEFGFLVRGWHQYPLAHLEFLRNNPPAGQP